MIYTTYFPNLRKLPASITPVSICGKAPDWYKGLQYKKLAPKYDFFMKWKETHDNNYYVKCFKEQVLNKLHPDEVLAEIYALAQTRDIALVCYEKPGDFCHRHLVADWLTENGFETHEWQ